jgi:DMSO/TMAO reductase YedYZ molybdopterin-dependent catalytic subunit
MSLTLPRRRLLTGLSASTVAALTSGCSYEELKPTFGQIFGAGDWVSYHAQKFLLSRQSLAREYGTADISRKFPVVGTRQPKSLEYRRLQDDGFRSWRLPVEGLVERPQSFSLGDLQSMPQRTQITSHTCEEGWTAIAQWNGVALHHVLAVTGIKSKARFVFYFSSDGWYDSLHLFDALHPQTLLACGMNGQPLPIQHGAPVRLRVERQLGQKSLKFLTRILVVESLKEVGNGLGSSGAGQGYSWNAGI